MSDRDAWELHVMEMLENMHVRLKEAGVAADAMATRIRVLELAVEMHRNTISILASTHRNERN